MKKKLSVFCSLLLVLSMIAPMAVMPVFAEEDDPATEETYTELESPSVTYNMNVDWKFKKASGTVYPLATAATSVKDSNGKNFYEVDYDDSDWETVSVPHPINAIDSFDDPGIDAGEQNLYRGFMFYRKHVQIPASDAGKKLFLEFEAFRQSVYVYVNGHLIGFYEAGTSPAGFDITQYAVAGGDNVIAVATDNSASRGNNNDTKETKYGSEAGAADGNGYQWNTKDFNEVQGGLTGNVNLYAKGTVYQTLPLYNNLKTGGNYIYGSNYDIDAKKATINVDAEVRNEGTAAKDITLQVDVVDMDGKLAYTYTKDSAVSVPVATDKGEVFETLVPEDAYEANPDPTDISTVDVRHIKASFEATDMRFWSDRDPYLYTVYTYLLDGEEIIDTQKIVTGFRKVEYTLGGGLKINDKTTYLKGYAQRSTNEWAVVGVANDWLSDKDMELVRESNANYIRWMHITPNPVDIRAGDKYGVISVCPAGDKEEESDGRSWDMRMEAMRNAIYYFRNSPSVLFWEAGNNAISAAHMQEMTDLKEKLDPEGGRFMGSRTIKSVDQIEAAEYVGTMENRNASDAKNSMISANKYMPIIETEYARDEAPRRVWDAFSPPDFDYVNKWLGTKELNPEHEEVKKRDGYDIWDQTSEDFAVGNASQYNQFWAGRVTAGGSELYTGAAIMVWSDSNMHNRNTSVENCRTSGKVDAVRIKKEAFYALQAAQSEDEARIHIVGHWNYPEFKEDDDNYWYFDRKWNDSEKYWEYTTTKLRRNPKNKTVYVIGSPDVRKVELFVNNVSKGINSKASNNFVYAFEGIDVTESGSISAKAYNDMDVLVAEDEIHTVGKAVGVDIQPVTGPDGLIADGSDVMYFDVAIVDEEGDTCPLAYDRMDLKLDGAGVLLGGYNSGVGEKNTTNKVEKKGASYEGYTFAECGVNRIFVRSTRNAGAIKLSVTVDGLGTFERDITSVAFDNSVGDSEGLSTQLQRTYALGAQPPVVEQKVEAFKPLAAPKKADFTEETGNTYTATVKDTNTYYTIKVNNTEVTTATEPYIPGGAAQTGVIAEVRPVLEALKTAGAPITYNYLTSSDDPVAPDYIKSLGKFPSILITGGLIDGTTSIALLRDMTDVYVDGAKGSLMDATPDVTEAGEYRAELKVMLGYLKGVSAKYDLENNIYNITYTSDSITPASISLSSAGDIQLNAVTETAMTPLRGKVTIDAATAISNAPLLIAQYKDGALVSLSQVASVSMAANESKTIYIPEDFAVAEGATAKALLWKSISGVEPLCAAVPIELIDYSKYTVVHPTLNFNTNTQTDGPDGTGYFQASAVDELIYDGTDTNSTLYGIGEWLKSESIFSMDFCFDDAAASFRFSNKNNKVGPSISYGAVKNVTGDVLRTQTGSSAYQALGNINIGEWYSMDIEGKMSGNIKDAGAVFRLYKYENGERVLKNTVEGFNLRNFGTGDPKNGNADNMKIDAVGISADNIKVVSKYASEVDVTALADEIDSNQSVLCSATAMRLGKTVTIPEFAWTLYNEDGTALNDSTISITNGQLTTTKDTQSKTVVVRATAQTEGNPYGEKKIKINAIDTSDDTFNSITLSSANDYVKAGETATISVAAKMDTTDVTHDAGDIVWKIYNEANLREVNNEGITIANGVVTVAENVIPQKITIRGSNKSGSAIDTLVLEIKPGAIIDNGETYGDGDACEEILTGLSPSEDSWDGSGYYKLTADKDFAGFSANTTENVIYSADVRFDEEYTGFGIYNENNGRFGMQVYRHEGKLSIQKDSSNYDHYFNVDPKAWYNVQIMTSTGNTNAYANLIVYKYDEQGNKVNPDADATEADKDKPYVKTGVTMRNLSATFSTLSPANHIRGYNNTSIDNVYCIKIIPDELQVSADKEKAFAGQSVQGSVTALRKDIPFGSIGSDLVRWVVYDENDENPLGDPLITVNDSGQMAIDAMAEAKVVSLRAASTDDNFPLHDSVRIEIQNSDIFSVETFGFNEEGTKLAELGVIKQYAYSNDVTFVVVTYNGTTKEMKSVFTKTLSGKNIGREEDESGELVPVPVSIDAPLPEDFDKDNDELWVYTLTSVSENEAVTEDDETIEATFSGNTLNFTKIPELDERRPVILMVLKPDTTTTAVEDSDIVYIKQLTGTTLAELESITVDSAAAGDYIIKIAGKKQGISVINTGIVTK